MLAGGPSGSEAARSRRGPNTLTAQNGMSNEQQVVTGTRRAGSAFLAGALGAVIALALAAPSRGHADGICRHPVGTGPCTARHAAASSAGCRDASLPRVHAGD
jgi:hypothetical protein